MTNTQATVVRLTPQIVGHVAKLAHLPLVEADIAKRTEELQSVLGYMNKIQSLDTENVPEMLQVSPSDNTMREDVIDESRTFTQEEALQNAPATHNGYIMVPAILGEN